MRGNRALGFVVLIILMQILSANVVFTGATWAQECPNGICPPR